MKKEKDLIFVDLEMLEFFRKRKGDGVLTLTAEEIMKVDPNLEEISAFHRKLFCEKKE